MTVLLGPLVDAARDSRVVAWRNPVNFRRNPDLLFGAVVNPIIFVLLFAYVFAGSLGGDGYRHFLVAGVFVQTVAVILGRTASGLVVSAVTLVIMTAAGVVVGRRIESSPVQVALGYLLLLLFGFAVSWVGAWIGLLRRSVEVAQSAGLSWLFPVSFIAGVFVSAQTLPGPLRAFAEWNPVSAVSDATRMLFGNPVRPPGIPAATGWVAEHATAYAVLSSLPVTAVFLPLALARYRRGLASR